MAHPFARAFALSALLAASPAQALDVLYCVPANGHVRAVKAVVWSMLFPGDTVRVVHREHGEQCVRTLLSPEKEQVITKALSEKGLSVQKYVTDEAKDSGTATPNGSDQALSTSCHMRLDFGAETRRWVYVQEGRWQKLESGKCQLDLNCHRVGTEVLVSVRFLPERDLSEMRLSAGRTWRVPVPTHNTCASPLEVGVD